jgi:uncharacterized protein YcbX
MPVEVTGLTIYPVKSMKGIDLKKAELTSAGLQHDRRFMVVRSNGRFVTQRELPRLSLIQTALADNGIRLSLPTHGETTLPYEPRGGEPVLTKVWGDVCQAVDEGDEASRWLTSALESDREFRLVRMAPGFERLQGKPDELGPETSTFFADAAPFLVVNESSLEALNTELQSRGFTQVPMNRFRPNIVVRGLEPFAEHKQAGLQHSAYALNFCHPCERCVVTTIDQDKAEKDPAWQPFKTLRDINPMPGKKPAPAFGQHATLRNGSQALISLGDQLAVTGELANP